MKGPVAGPVAGPEIAISTHKATRDPQTKQSTQWLQGGVTCGALMEKEIHGVFMEYSWRNSWSS